MQTEPTDKKISDTVNCMVCLQECQTVSSDLFLYNCTCIYPIHNDCFQKWRRIADTSRICIICDKYLDTFPKELRLDIRRMGWSRFIVATSYTDRRFQYYGNRGHRCLNKNICLFIWFILIFLLFLPMFKPSWEQRLASSSR